MIGSTMVATQLQGIYLNDFSRHAGYILTDVWWRLAFGGIRHSTHMAFVHTLPALLCHGWKEAPLFETLPCGLPVGMASITMSICDHLSAQSRRGDWNAHFASDGILSSATQQLITDT